MPEMKIEKNLVSNTLNGIWYDLYTGANDNIGIRRAAINRAHILRLDEHTEQEIDREGDHIN